MFIRKYCDSVEVLFDDFISYFNNSVLQAEQANSNLFYTSIILRIYT